MINEIINCFICITFVSVLILQTLQKIETASLTPFNYLVPPPLHPTKLPPLLASFRSPEQQYNSNALTSHYKSHNEIRGIHQFRNNQSLLSTADTPGFMSKIVKWFGFGRNAKAADASMHTGASSNKHLFKYDFPEKVMSTHKDLCDLCNKYPWMPILPNSIEADKPFIVPTQSPNFSKTYNQQLQLAQPSSIIKQRAAGYSFHNQPGPFVPVPIPRLNDSQYHNLLKAQFSGNNINENFYIHDQDKNIIYGNKFIPTHIPSALQAKSQLDFEIIKSHQLTDFIASVEHPSKLMQGPVSLDTHILKETDTLPNNHKADIFSGLSRDHHLEIPNNATNLHSILGSSPQIASKLYITNFSNNSTYHLPNEFADEYDNFPSASAQNATVLQGSLILYNHTNNMKSNVEDVFYDSSVLAKPITNFSEIITRAPVFVNPEIRYENLEENSVEFLGTTPKTTYYNNTSYLQYGDKIPQGNVSDILSGASVPQPNKNFEEPRPFKKEHLYFNDRTVVQRPKQIVPVDLGLPTHTSTYSAIDASGQFAGISPPNPPTAQFVITENRNSSKLRMPFMTRSRPRPFEVVHGGSPTTWSHQFKPDFYKPQESVMITVKTENTALANTTSRNIKYLTKILASNLHELLKREHILHKNILRNFDIKKFQGNIDNWTEQEYNSLSRKLSTPTTAGRSKNIPPEYLPSTKMIKLHRLPKTSKIFNKPSDLTFSVNNLDEPSKYHYHAIESHHYPDIQKKQFKEINNTNKTEFIPKITYNISSKSIENSSSAFDNFIHTSREPWQNTKVSISPQTREMVYIVTPQPRFHLKRLNIMATSRPPPTIKIRKSNIKTSRFRRKLSDGNANGNETVHIDYNKANSLKYFEPSSGVKYATTAQISKDTVQQLTSFTTPVDTSTATSKTIT